METIKRAIRSGDLDALEEHKLQEMNVDVDTGLGSDDFTPLHWACYYGQAEVVLMHENEIVIFQRDMMMLKAFF